MAILEPLGLLEPIDVAEECRVLAQISDGGRNAMFVEDILQCHMNNAIVLHRRQRARGVDKAAARLEQSQAIGQYASLQFWDAQTFLDACRLEDVVVLMH